MHIFCHVTLPSTAPKRLLTSLTVYKQNSFLRICILYLLLLRNEECLPFLEQTNRFLKNLQQSVVTIFIFFKLFPPFSSSWRDVFWLSSSTSIVVLLPFPFPFRHLSPSCQIRKSPILNKTEKSYCLQGFRSGKALVDKLVKDREKREKTKVFKDVFSEV
ncbi:hypothetical protein CDAR_620941 [Caerostris darwini]|uniref:Uncharacterized protein n=1 Tax=Caerostris darwini TaxID=1538125 RepID=A0AAV4URQ4_9ARAC|nr:hypothetical protein CDAR_620941 [Caerostris darwini]